DGRAVPAGPPDTRRAGGVRRRPRLLLRPRAGAPGGHPGSGRTLRGRLLSAVDRGPEPEGRGGGDRDGYGPGPGACGSGGGEPRRRGPTGPRAARRRERLRAAVRARYVRPRLLGGALPRARRGRRGRGGGAAGALVGRASRRAGRDGGLRGHGPGAPVGRRRVGRGACPSGLGQGAIRHRFAGAARRPAREGSVRCAVAGIRAAAHPAPGQGRPGRGGAGFVVRPALRERGAPARTARSPAGARPARGVHAAGRPVRRGACPWRL
ncbi:MAG: hypothetical protein AVDCRST_MAG05-1544, partial [uncultured Rubrobacteraceae bacterium]